MKRVVGLVVAVSLSLAGCGRSVLRADVPPGGVEFCRQSTGKGFSWHSYVVQSDDRPDGTTLVFTDSYPVADGEIVIQVSQATRNAVSVDCRGRTFQGGPIAVDSCADKMLSIVCR